MFHSFTNIMRLTNSIAKALALLFVSSATFDTNKLFTNKFNTIPPSTNNKTTGVVQWHVSEILFMTFVKHLLSSRKKSRSVSVNGPQRVGLHVAKAKAFFN